jgi:hypothetical protein
MGTLLPETWVAAFLKINSFLEQSIVQESMESSWSFRFEGAREEIKSDRYKRQT